MLDQPPHHCGPLTARGLVTSSPEHAALWAGPLPLMVLPPSSASQPPLPGPHCVLTPAQTWHTGGAQKRVVLSPCPDCRHWVQVRVVGMGPFPVLCLAPSGCPEAANGCLGGGNNSWVTHRLTCECLRGGGQANTRGSNFKSTQISPRPQCGQIPGGSGHPFLHVHYRRG